MASWVCRDCPAKLAVARRVIEEMLTYNADIVPDGIDYDAVIAAISKLEQNAIANLKLAGRWP